MPSFVRSIMESNTSAYVYDISGESPNEVAQRLMSTVDSSFDFIGSVNGRQATLPIQYVESTLGRGGMVAAETTMHGVPVVIRFQDARTLVIRPSNSAKNVADAIAGVSQYTDTYEDPYEDDFVDPFQTPAKSSYDDGFNEFSAVPSSDFDDPRAMANTNYESYPSTEAETNQNNQIVGKGEWFLMFIILAIPVVNLIALLIWLISKKTKKSKKNFIVAQILLFLINFALIFGLAFFALQSGIVSMDTIKKTLEETPYASVFVPEGNNTNEKNNSKDNSNENANENKNSNSNMNKNANNNKNVINTSGENIVNTANEVTQSNSNTSTQAASVYAVTSYSFACAFSAEGKKIGIVTLQITNNSNVDLVASNQLSFEVQQGQNSLTLFGTAIAGYDPANINTAITPGSTGNLVLAYELVDDQQVHFRALQADTRAVLTDVYFATY